MKFFIVGCLFDYYVYTISTKRTFSLVHDAYKETDDGYTCTFCIVECFIVSYTCVFTSIETKRCNKGFLIETLGPNCYAWLTDWHISRAQKPAKSCFQTLKKN